MRAGGVRALKQPAGLGAVWGCLRFRNDASSPRCALTGISQPASVKRRFEAAWGCAVSYITLPRPRATPRFFFPMFRWSLWTVFLRGALGVATRTHGHLGPRSVVRSRFRAVRPQAGAPGLAGWWHVTSANRGTIQSFRLLVSLSCTPVVMNRV